MKTTLLAIREKKKYISALIIAGVLGLIIMMPQIYFSIMDCCAYQREHKMEKINFELSSDVKDIVIVERLHEMLNSYYLWSGTVDIYADDGKLLEYVSVNAQEANDSKKISSVLRETGLMQYISANVSKRFMYCIQTSNNNGINQYKLIGKKGKLEFKWDEETNKILYLKYEGKGLKEITDSEIYNIESNYIKYMNMSIIEDWNYNNGKMVSKKAHLCVELNVNKSKNTLEMMWKLIN